MKKWPKVALGEILRQRKEFVTIDDTTSYKRCRVQLHAQGVVLRDVVSGAQVKTKKQQVCRGGEFLVAEIDAKMGGYGLVPAALEGAVVSSHYFLFELDREQVNEKFLGYFSRSTAFRSQVAAQGSTNYAAIRPAHVLEYTIPLPRLAEQEAIVARLDALETRVRQVAEHLDAADTLGASLLLSLHHKLARDRVIRLAEVLELYEEEEIITPTTRYPQVGVRGFGGGLFPKVAVGGNETSYRSFNRLYEGAIVLSQVKGWEGAIARCPRELDGWFVSPEYRTFRRIAGAGSDKYLGAIMATEWFWSKLQDATRGVGARRERTRPEQFLQIELPLPELPEQEQILRILQRQEPLKLKHSAIRAANAALIPATLERIFADAD